MWRMMSPRLGVTGILALLISSASSAQPGGQGPSEQGDPGVEKAIQEESAELAEEKAEPKNGLLFGFSHALRLSSDRESADRSESRRAENVYGFLFGYERVLHPYVALSIVKPFYFNSERIESPLEIVVSGIFRRNAWEPFLGAGVISTISSVEEDGSEPNGKVVEFSVGLLFITGFKYFFNPNWAFELELGYEFIPKGTVVEHAFADTYQGAYFF
jgi:hypothetical protein